MLGRRAFALESAAARVCREAGARVTTNVMVKDLDLVPQERVDGRRLEVVADGFLYSVEPNLPWAPLWSRLKRDGTPQPGQRRRRWGCSGGAPDDARNEFTPN